MEGHFAMDCKVSFHVAWMRLESDPYYFDNCKCVSLEWHVPENWVWGTGYSVSAQSLTVRGAGMAVAGG